MATEGQTLDQWLYGAGISSGRLSGQQRAVLEAAFRFLQQGDGEYAASRMVGYFLLHCGAGLGVAQVARLVGISPRTASRHRKLSAREVSQQIHHHFRGRPYGKLLPRHLGPIAEFLFTRPEATREDLLNFIARIWGFRVSHVALWEFLKKYGLDRVSLDAARQAAGQEEQAGFQQDEESPAIESLEAPSSGGLVPVVGEEFFLPRPSMPGPSCCGPRRSRGLRRPASASTTNTARWSAGS